MLMGGRDAQQCFRLPGASAVPSDYGVDGEKLTAVSVAVRPAWHN
jgi:hypothetical protein